MIKGPATAVSAPINVNACLIGLGKELKNSKALSTMVIILVLIVKKASPNPAKSAFKLSSALLYLPAADSVTAVNSREATLSRSAALAFIKSRTCKV